MKQLIFLSMIAVGLIFINIGCDKDEVPELTERNIPQAVIKGKVFANLNVSSGFSGYESAPSGTKIMAQVWTGDLMPGVEEGEEDGFVHTYKNYETTVDGSGEYSISVDATTDGLTVRVICDDFEYDQIQGIHPIDSTQLAPIRRVYRVSDFEVAVVAGKTSIRDIYYSEF